MLIVLTTSFYFLVALALVILRWVRPGFRYAWLMVAGSALVAWISVLIWQSQLPVNLQLPPWEPSTLYLESLSFTVDPVSWPFAFSIVTIILAIILTATARENFPAPIPWAATLVFGSLGILAVTADNPLSLLMIWSAIDLAELVAQLRSVDGPQPSEKVVTAFSARLAGIGMLLWANMVSISTGAPLNFRNVPPQSGLYLLIAAGLRLGVLPLHLPYASEVAIRRGYGSALRLISAASSLILLARIPTISVLPLLTPVFLSLIAFAAIYSSWMWLRSPNELEGRPFWLIGLASLAMASALQGNPTGAAAWSCALILCGGTLFLTSAYHDRINRALWIGLWGLSALPFTLTATGWEVNASPFWPARPFLLSAQALLLAGYYRHATRPTQRASFEGLDRAAKVIYPFGIGIPLFTVLMFGLLGWAGARNLGVLPFAIISLLLASIVLWLVPRLGFLKPLQANWIDGMTTSWMDSLFRALWGLYRLASRIGNAISAILEGEGGLMWTLLFLVLFISLLAQGVQ